MEKTFNLNSYMEKTANMAYEGSQGYFLAQQRAWMNCSKCKREKGRSAQEAWQECFDEFQEGDRKMSWLANYASDEIQNVKKESAIDYSAEVIKLASSGMEIKDAVNSTLQQRLAWNFPWSKKQTPQQTPQQATQSPSQKATDYETQAKRENVGNQLKGGNPQPTKNQDQFRANMQKKQTYNILHQISELVKQDVYDSDTIRKIIARIPNQDVKDKFLSMDKQIQDVENGFSKMIERMSQEALAIMKTYQDSQFKNFFAPPKQNMAADFPTTTAPQSQTAPAQSAAPYKVKTKAIPPNYNRGKAASVSRKSKFS